MRIRRGFMVVLASVLLLALCMVSGAAWQQEEAPIRVGWFLQPSYQELDDSGSPWGYNFDYLADISRYTGWTYEYVTTNAAGGKLSWHDALEMVRRGELDLMGCVQYSDAREAEYGLSEIPAGHIFTSLFVRRDSPLTGDDYDALNGITAAAVTATKNDEDLLDYAAQYGFTIGRIQNCTAIPDVMSAVLDGTADAGVIGSYQPDANTRAIANFSPSPFYFITRKDNADVLAALNRAMNSINISDPYYAQTLAGKYSQTYQGEVVYSAQEKEYIAARGPVRVVCCPDWFPLVQRDAASGEVTGVVRSVWDLVSEETGLQFDYFWVDSAAQATEALAGGDCDMLPCMSFGAQQPGQASGLLFGDKYLTFQLILVRKNTAQAENPVIGIMDCNACYEVIKSSGVRYVCYPSTEDCFEALRRGEVDEIIVNSYASNYFLNQRKYTSFIRSTLQGVSVGIGLCVRADAEGRQLLLPILNKALSTIDNTALNSIMVSNTMEAGSWLEAIANRIPAKTAAAIILFLFVLILLFVLFFLGFVSKSKEARAATERANQALVTDTLTGLLNENGFLLASQDCLRQLPDAQFFIVDFDLDFFEHFNAIYGFERGDEILRLLAGMAKEMCGGPGELCARVHADHFVCLMTGGPAAEIEARIVRANERFQRAAASSGLPLSYGVYEIHDREMPFTLMCDCALAAKRTVKGNFDKIFAVYDEQLHHRQIEDSELLRHMDEAIQNGEFLAYYQPKYDIHTEKIAGAEALVRWRQADGSLVQPDRFIPLFERNGQIAKLDMYMLDTVCRRLRAQLDAGLRPVPVSVNFSRNHLYDEQFSASVSAAVRQHGIDPRLVEIELTESAFLENEGRLLTVIDELHREGFLVSIDDFGSGFSSLNMLKDLRFDIIKLDRGFLIDTTSSERGKTVVRSVLELAGRLSFITVAEGVETREQLELLRQYGCDIAQGFYFARPLPGDEFDRCLTGPPAAAPR